MYSEPGTGPTTVAIAPTATVIDTFIPRNMTSAWVSIENLDAVQTMAVTVQVRLVAGSGSWFTTVWDTWSAVGPLAIVVDVFDVFGAAEVRIVGTASGAGGNISYIRRNGNRNDASRR